MVRLSFIILLLLGHSAFAQIDSIKSFTPFIFNDTIKIAISIRDPANVDIKKQTPLILVNNKKFSKTPINQLFLDITNIKAVNVISPANHSAHLYGPKAKNGVIILTTKQSIDWLTSKQIIKQYAKGASRKRTLFIVDNEQFEECVNLYFEKGVIANIEVQDSASILNNKKYSKIIKIKTNRNGT